MGEWEWRKELEVGGMEDRKKNKGEWRSEVKGYVKCVDLRGVGD